MDQLVEHRIHYKDGSLKAKGQYLDGSMHGYWEWFRIDGSKMRSGNFDRGESVGEWITYDRKSQPYKVTQKKSASQEDIQSVDVYIRQFPWDVQERLERIRALIKASAPEAEEKIAYGIPTFFCHENLVHFAAFKKHIGFYPTPSVIKAFEKALTMYKYAKGSIQFPFDQPLPLVLIKEMVDYRVKEHHRKAK